VTTIDVQLRPTWIRRVGYRYDVILDDEVIVRQSRDPEYDTARVLHARGLRGRFRTIDFRTGEPRMILDIAKAAKLCTVERANKGPPTVGPYRPLSDDARARLRPHSLHQGRVLSAETAHCTGQPAAAAGGGGCAGERPTNEGSASRGLREDPRHRVSQGVRPKPAGHARVPVEHEEA